MNRYKMQVPEILPSIAFSSSHSMPLVQASLDVTHIKAEPYSFVVSVVKNISIPNNLTFVLPRDPEDTIDQMFYYYLLAVLIIAVVIVSFIRGSHSDPLRKQTYSSLPERSLAIETIELEYEN